MKRIVRREDRKKNKIKQSERNEKDTTIILYFFFMAHFHDVWYMAVSDASLHRWV